MAKKRLVSILGRHVVAPMRTLEQKIADAGPTPQRIDPHLITVARRELRDSGTISSTRRNGLDWYHLSTTDTASITQRLAELGPIHDQTSHGTFTTRAGQTLEIAVFRALRLQPHPFFGAYPDLTSHDDSTMFSKVEPPNILSGVPIPGDGRLDFLVVHPAAGYAGIEAKNIREWIYPDRPEVADLLHKCGAVDAVPVLICRRLAYSTFSVLHSTGVIVHQTYNQLYPYTDAALAAQASHKDLLGYHDIRLGNEPSPRLLLFIKENLPRLLPEARRKFDVFRDLLQAYGAGDLGFPEFAWKVRRREAGESEESEPQDDWMPF